MFSKEVIIKCDYTDLEKVILDHYGHDYDIMPMEEVGSSQYSAVYKRTVSKGELDEYDMTDIWDLERGERRQFTLNSILTDLCNKGIIDAGEYYIDVNW